MRLHTVLLACVGCVASSARRAERSGPDRSVLAFVTEGELESWKLPLWMTQPLSWPAGARAEGLSEERSSEIRRGAAEWIRLCVRPELLPKDLDDKLQLFSDAFVLDPSWKRKRWGRRRRKADAAAVRYVVGERQVQIIDGFDRIVIYVRIAESAPEKDKGAILEFCRAVSREILHPSLHAEKAREMYVRSDTFSPVVAVTYIHPGAKAVPRSGGKNDFYYDTAGCPFGHVTLRTRGNSGDAILYLSNSGDVILYLCLDTPISWGYALTMVRARMRGTPA